MLARYDFDFSDNRMLYDGSPDRPTHLQLNSVRNYIAYHVVSLLEQVRRLRPRRPLRVLVLGCTHFPFYTDAIRSELRRLYNYSEAGRYLYRDCMAAKIQLIDPAYFVGREVYERLADAARLRRRWQPAAGRTRAEFYITVPDRRRPGVQLEPGGWFTYEYKYGRPAGRLQLDYRHVPLTRRLLAPADRRRLRRRAPAAWKLLEEFWSQNAKLRQAVEVRWSPAGRGQSRADAGQHARASASRSASNSPAGTDGSSTSRSSPGNL
jgi:hypothetical protein